MTSDGMVEVSVEVAARIATVFRFLSERERLSAWLGEGAEVDPRPGGALRVAYPTGEVAVGEVESVEAGRSLTFTWGYEGGTHGLQPGASRVVIELEPTASGTRVTLRHAGLPSAEVRQGHAHGWRHYLSVLAAKSAEGEFEGRLAHLVDTFVAAWNERDGAARAVLLEASFEPNGFYLDANARLSGRGELGEYIAGAQGFMPGFRFVLAGPVDQVHDRVRFPWRFEAADGTWLGTGWDVGRVTLEGRFAEVVGFWEAPPVA